MSSSAISAARAAQEGYAATELSKSAKKNAKRREKKDEDEDVRPGSTSEPVKDSWEEDEEEEASTAAVIAPVPSTEAIPEPPAEVKEVDPEKKARAVQKKLRQAEALRERATKGEKLLPEQEEKVASIPSLEEELEKLKV